MWRRTWVGSILLVIGYFSHAQITTSDTLSLQLWDLPLENVLDTISGKTGYFFSYNTNILPNNRLYTFQRKGVKLKDLLNDLFADTGLQYLIVDDQIILKKVKKRLFFSRKETSENTIRGRAKLRDSDVFLPGVNVFIDGTTMGTVTGADGEYILKKVPDGVHQLVFSHIGYVTFSQTVKMSTGSEQVVNAFMMEQPGLLDSVEVISERFVDSKLWQKYFQVFKNEFLGRSPNAAGASIVNPEVLNFTYNDDTDIIRAYAEAPLEIKNNALGYLITCQLEYFKKEKDVTSFHIKARFTRMEAAGRKEKRKWKKNRKAAYEGSSTHFLKSLIRNNYENEGFRMYKVDSTRLVRVKRSEILHASKYGPFWKLSFEGTIYVNYQGEIESKEYIVSTQVNNDDLHRKSGKLRYQSSSLELAADEVAVFNNGQVQKPAQVLKKGYWSWERVADLVPIDYDLKK